MKVISAFVRTYEKYANVDIIVDVENAESVESTYDENRCATACKGVWECRNGVYRAQIGDAVRFFAYQGPSFGFGGGKFALTMQNGEVEVLKGPWSSRASVVNAEYPDKDACIEVDGAGTRLAVVRQRLEELGIVFKAKTYSDGEVCHEVDLEKTPKALIHHKF